METYEDNLLYIERLRELHRENTFKFSTDHYLLLPTKQLCNIYVKFYPYPISGIGWLWVFFNVELSFSLRIAKENSIVHDYSAYTPSVPLNLLHFHFGMSDVPLISHHFLIWRWAISHSINLIHMFQFLLISSAQLNFSLHAFTRFPPYLKNTQFEYSANSLGQRSKFYFNIWSNSTVWVLRVQDVSWLMFRCINSYRKSNYFRTCSN